MEIIHIILGKANPDRLNGVNKVVYHLATRQHEHNLNVSVWGITKDTSKNYGERNFKTRLFKKMMNPFNPGDQLLEAMLSKKGQAVFHIHGGWVPVFSKIASFLNSHAIPYVFTPHGAYNTIAMKRSSFTKKIYFNLFEKHIVEYAAKIHCIGQSEIVGLNSIYKTNKAVLLPYGFNMSFEPVCPNANREELIIGFVGRLDIYTKGLDLLLDAFESFQKDTNNSRLWIIGDGPERAKLAKIIENRGLNTHVVLFGSKFGIEKDMLIKQMHVFAHPSRNEGLPSSVLEASNFGIPCIVSKATNVSEYIEQYNSGIVIENENAEAIKRAFYRIYDMWGSQSLPVMKYNAQRMVRNAFNWGSLIGRFNQLYAI